MIDQRRHEAASRATSRTIAELRATLDEVAAGMTRVSNVWGVVLDFRSPFFTRGSDLKAEMNILDDSVQLYDQRLRVYQFVGAQKLWMTMPMRCMGDIIFISNVEAKLFQPYSDGSGKSHLQAFVRDHCSVYLFDAQGDSCTPVGTRIGSRPYKLTESDYSRLQELRQWSLHNVARFSPMIFTTTDVTYPLQDMRCIVKSLKHTSVESMLEVVLVNSDFAERSPPFRLTVAPSTVDLLISLKLAPSLPRAAFVRDVRIIDDDGTGVAQLSLVQSQHPATTSTIIFCAQTDHARITTRKDAEDIQAEGRPAAAHNNAQPSSSHVVTIVGDEDLPHSLLRDLINSPDEVARKRCKVSFEGVLFPRDLRQVCRPVCSNCSEWVYNPVPEATSKRRSARRFVPETIESVFECSVCLGTNVKYDVFMRVLLRDATGDGVAAFVTGIDGCCVLGNLTPCNLYCNPPAHKQVLQCIELLTRSSSVVDCILVAYDDVLLSRNFHVVDTMLGPDAFALQQQDEDARE